MDEDSSGDEEALGNQSQGSSSLSRHSTSAPLEEEDEASNLGTAIQPHSPHYNNNAHRFGRPDTDWLRKRAITGAMRSTVTEPVFKTSPVHLTGYAERHGPAPSREEVVQTTPTPTTTSNNMPGEPSPFAHRDDEYDVGHVRNAHRTSSSIRPSVEVQSSSGMPNSSYNYGSVGDSPSPSARQTVTPTLWQNNPNNSPPPAVLGNATNWLLPRPFSRQDQLPSVGRTSYQESPEPGSSFGIPSLSSTRSSSERGWGSGASTPVSLERGSLENTVMRSPYFRSGNTRPESTVAGASGPSYPLPAAEAAMAAHHSDPFVVSRVDQPPSECSGALQNPHQQHHGLWTDRHAPTSHSGAHHLGFYGSSTGSLNSSPPARHDVRPAAPKAEYFPAVESELAFGPSTASRAATQAFTPATSPYRRDMAQLPVGVQGESSGVNDTSAAASAVDRPAGQWHEPRCPPGFRLHLGSPLYRRRQDSSILSPPGHLRGPQYMPPPAQALAERSMDSQWDEMQAQNRGGLDFDLSSDSESDNGGLIPHHAVPTAQRAHADGGTNFLSASEPTDEQDCVVCAISESRSSEMVGMAVINLTMGHVDLVRVVNDDKYRRLTETLWRMPTWPQTFLVLKKVVDQPTKSALVVCLEKEFPGIEVVALDREHWNESEGLRMVDRFAWRTDIKAIRRNLEHNFYVSCAFSAVMAYVEEETDVIFRDNSLRIRYKQPADTMGLDRSTITFLELFQNIRNAKGKSSTLFCLLNNTLTPQGRRMVRSVLLQPSTNKDEITARHEAVEELSSNEDLFTEVRASLKRLNHIDVERSIPWVSLKTGEPRPSLQDGVALIQGRHQIAMPSHEELQGAERDLNHVLMIKAYLGGIQAVRETLEAADCTSQLLRWVLEKCGQGNTAPIVGLIQEAIEQDAVFSKAPIDTRNNRLWAIKSEPNSVLEGSRQMYRDRTNEMHQCVEGLNKTFQEYLGTTPELRLANDNHYCLRFQWSDVEREVSRGEEVAEGASTTGDHDRRPRRIGPRTFAKRLLGGVEIVNGIRRKQHYDCQTLELIQRSSQIQRHADIVTTQSDTYVVDLKKALLEHAGCFLAVNEAVAVLDMLCSFAHLATSQNYVRPIIADNLVLKGARHPVIEVRRENFVPNDVYSGDHGARFQVVTGGNMSGKSTFIRTIALVQIMAQVGSFVPATYAAIPICDRLFTRLSTEDKPESNLGTFAVEMTEMNMILRQVTRDSLVIIDELGRGTSTQEGLAIALSMSEELIKTECRVFFATHFTELARVLNATKPTSVLNVHIAGESTKTGRTAQISLPHTIASGPVKNEDYGLDLARRFLPERVVKNAEQVSTFLRDKGSRHAAGPATRAAKQSKLVLALPDLLKQADTSTMDDSALSSYINKLQTEFTIRMNIEADDDAQEEQSGESSKQALERPVLDKPSEEELEEWNKKSEAAERRVMHANMAYSQDKKRPASAGESSEYGQKRNKTDDSDGTQSMASQFTPINRGAMIEALRRGACTPTTRAETPSSVTMSDLLGSNHDAPVMGERMTREATPHPVLGRGHQRVASVSSVSTTYDHDMPDVEESKDALPASSEWPGAEASSGSVPQPLERFQPLKEWYSRNNEGQASASSSGASASEGGSTPASLRRSRSGTEEFLGFMDGDGDKEGRYE